MSPISLNIKNSNPYLFAKLFNILNFNPKKLDIQKTKLMKLIFTISTMIKILFT